MKIGVLPAAGKATRLSGLPKFALPLFYGASTILRFQLDRMLEAGLEVFIPTRPETASLAYSIAGKDATVLILETNTMPETILRLHELLRADSYTMGFPDTVFMWENPYLTLGQQGEEAATLACFQALDWQIGQVGQVRLNGTRVVEHKDKDSECDFPLVWGAVSFGNALLSMLSAEDAAIGVAFDRALAADLILEAQKFNGYYYDLGTTEGLRTALIDMEKTGRFRFSQ